MLKKILISLIISYGALLLFATPAKADILPEICATNPSAYECTHFQSISSRRNIPTNYTGYVNVIVNAIPALLMTILIEGVVVLIMLRPITLRKVLTVILVNIFTFTSLVMLLVLAGSLNFNIFLISIISELMVIIAEALVYAKVLKLKAKKAILISVIANFTSIIFGLIFAYIAST